MREWIELEWVCEELCYELHEWMELERVCEKLSATNCTNLSNGSQIVAEWHNSV